MFDWKKIFLLLGIGHDIATAASRHEVGFGHHRDHHSLNKRFTGPYNSIAVFGASWCDNAHSRPAEYVAASTRPPPYYEGRFSDGIVFNEYLAQMWDAKLYNFAYGGAHVDNSLTGGSVPDTKAQAKNYTTLSTSVIPKPKASAPRLHIWWIGINTVRSYSTADSAALTSVDQNVASLKAQIVSVYNKYNFTGADHLVINLPPMELVPTVVAEGAASVTRLRTLSQRYNKGVAAMVDELKTSWANVTGSGRMFFWDYEKEMYKKQHYTPEAYGFTNSTGWCLDSNTNVPCTNVKDYLHWDSLHLTTKAHQEVAKAINVIVAA
ncbi:hypothetical protein BT69DRAFT_1328612 [Atractiella rhizophila]|nr:hypothetical protein BT69DRAFT_1328612 [Atractiella rhizophila]